MADNALAAARARLGHRAGTVSWIVADLLSWQPPRRYQLWHDRAVFHSLTDAADRQRYRSVLHQALAPGGHAVVGTFAADGPTRCSGLPTARYSADELAAEFPGYRVVRHLREEHRTPSGGISRSPGWCWPTTPRLLQADLERRRRGYGLMVLEALL